MCGIAGLVNAKSPVDRERLLAMRETLRHRGPDDRGEALFDTAGLCHTRLAIIDPTKGRQPVVTPDGRYTLVFNGEIYNYRELKKELEGYPFATRSDSEVLLAAFQKWGSDCLPRLNGIFAFAVWDREERRLFLARDPYGVKPVYYREGEAFAFASEIKALLAADDTAPALDRQALADLLAYRYNPSPRTLFSGIKKLPPGHCAWWHEGTLEIKRWYLPPEPIKEDDEALLTGRLASLIEDGIHRQLVSDVPVAALLSGGVDSSLVTTLAARYYGTSLTAYTAGFQGGPGMDERAAAKKLCDHMGIRHETVEVTPGDFIDTLGDMVHHLEEPSATTSALPLYLLCHKVGLEHKVALSGQGADELFAGYTRHLATGLSRPVSALFRSATLARLAGMAGGQGVKRAFYALGEEDPVQRLLKTFSLFTEQERRDLMKEYADADTGPIAFLLQERRGEDPLNDMLHVEAGTSLPDDLLTYTDKTAMASGVEVRVPLLDIPLARFAHSLPSRMKLRGMTRKYLFKKAAARYLPQAILNRPKLGFESPLNDWLSRSLSSRARAVCLDGSGLCSSLFNREKLEGIFADHEQGRADNGKQIFLLLSLELWAERFGVEA